MFILTGVDMFTFWLLISLFCRGFPSTDKNKAFFFNYFCSIPERRGPLPPTICLYFVRSELATSWSHEMKTKCPMWWWWWSRLQWDGSVLLLLLLLPTALEPNRCSEGSARSQVFPGTRRFSREHVGSRAGAEQHLRNHQRGRFHRDSTACFTRNNLLFICDCTLTFHR